MKILLFLSLILNLLYANTNNEILGTKEDKLKHFGYSAAISSCSYLILNNEAFNLSENEKLLYSFSTSMLIGIGKEIYDSKEENNHFDKNDLFADFLGTTTGLGISYLINNYFFNSEKLIDTKISENEIQLKYNYNF